MSRQQELSQAAAAAICHSDPPHVRIHRLQSMDNAHQDLGFPYMQPHHGLV